MAFLIGPGCELGWLLPTDVGCATVTVSTAAATAAATAVADEPLKGLLALNSRHLAPSTVIILDMGILGFFLAIRGLSEQKTKAGGFIVSHLIPVCTIFSFARRRREREQPHKFQSCPPPPYPSR